ncbi:hypothetical protein IWX90DRAFT_137782 [Phyllosticta citrichinensis]|uniref:Uncharacterized protein n=1 Tax=Phyllosticta citrichinensis TaxID=1130410 RepID=A0ABR1XY74_9PEZI
MNKTLPRRRKHFARASSCSQPPSKMFQLSSSGWPTVGNVFFLTLVLPSGVSSGADPQALKLILKRRRVEPSLPTLFPPGPPALPLLLVMAQPKEGPHCTSQLPLAPSPLCPPTKGVEPCRPLAAQTPHQPQATSSTSKTRLSPPSFASPASLVQRLRTSFLCPDSCPLGAWLRATAQLEPTQAFSKPFGCRPPASIKSMPTESGGGTNCRHHHHHHHHPLPPLPPCWNSQKSCGGATDVRRESVGEPWLLPPLVRPSSTSVNGPYLLNMVTSPNLHKPLNRPSLSRLQTGVRTRLHPRDSRR